MLPKLALNAEEITTLKELLRNHSKAHVRQRAQIILLHWEGFAVDSLARIAHRQTHTIYEWLRRYRSHGFLGLMIRTGRGVKAKMDSMDDFQQQQVRDAVAQHPQNLRAVSQMLSTQLGYEVTKLMLKRCLKKN